MSGDSDSLHLIESDEIKLDSSDELIELDSEDADSDHNEDLTLIAKDGTDIRIVESEGCKSGLESVAHKSNGTCMTSTNGLSSEDCFGSKGGSSVEQNATELTGSTQLSSESAQNESLTKVSLTSGAEECTDVPSLESLGHKLGLDSEETLSDEKCLISNVGLASTGSLGSKDKSNVEGTDSHGSATELAASKQLSSECNQKGSLTLGVKEYEDIPSLESKLRPDSGDDKSHQTCVATNNGVASGGTLESKDAPTFLEMQGNVNTSELAASKQSTSGNKDSKANSEKKPRDGSDDAKKKSTSTSRRKKDESHSDKNNSKKQSQSCARKDSSTKSNRISAKKDSETSRTKRNRSGSRHREDEARKRRRTSRSRSRSRYRDRHSRTRDTFDHEREKARQVSDILQSKIDRLKEEVEKARAELKHDSRHSRSRSSDRRGRLHGDRHSNPRTGNSVHYRSRSRSLDRVQPSGSALRRSPLPSVQRFLDAGYSGNSEEKSVVVIKKVDAKNQRTQFSLLTKFKRYGEVLDSNFDKANEVAILYYKRPQSAEEAVRNMHNRYFEGEYLKVLLVNERDVELAVAANCSQCGKDHTPNECPQLKCRSHSRRRESRARSSSLELHWPVQPRHPSTNLFDQLRSLSPLSLLMANESLRNGGIRPVLLRPKPLPTTIPKTSEDLPLGPERLAKREMMMKKMNSVVKCDWGERSMSDFEVLATVGKGTYGQMYKAADKDLKLLMALKKVTVESDKSGFPVSALQEMKLLSRLDHPNIVKLVEILVEDQENFIGARKAGSFYFVYDYMNHDLKRLLQSKLLQLKSEDIAWFIKQLLNALSYCHRIGLVHRDVRPSNILINNRGELKLAQFGLACLYEEKAEPSASSPVASTEQRMISLWYRAPEVLLGEKKSSPATDVWSCGCVVGEIFSRKPIFLGSDEQHQIEVISKVCGTPNTSNWPNVTLLPLHYILKNVEDYPRLFHDAFHYVPYMARNLLDRLLVMDPSKRLTAELALDTDWLKDADFPKMLPMMLVNINDCHMLMPAKSPIDSDVPSLPGVGKVSAIGLEQHKLDSFAGSSFAGRMRREDVSDKVAITHSLGSNFVPESDTVRKPQWSSASRETNEVLVADVVSRKPAEKPYPTSSQPSRRAFNPRVMDYACQPTYAKQAYEKPVQQPEKLYTGSLSVRSSANIDDRTQVTAEKSVRYESLPQRTRPSGEGMKVYTDRVSGSFESRPTALPSDTKPLAQAADDRTLSADLERLKILKKQLELAKEKRDALANLAKARSGLADVGNTGSQVSLELKDQRENAPLRKRTDQPPVVRTTNLRGEPEATTSRGNVEIGYRGERQPAVGPQSWPTELSDFGARSVGWDGSYNKTREEENQVPSQEPRFSVNWNEGRAANPLQRPAVASGRASATYGDSGANRLHQSSAAVSECDDSTPYNSGGWGVSKQPEVRPPYDRKPFASQMHPGMRGRASAAQTRDEPFSRTENAASQRWGGDREMAGHYTSRYPGRGFAEPELYADERWRADDRLNEAPRPHTGPFHKEPDVEWRAPQSRF